MINYKVQSSIRKQVFKLQALLGDRLTVRGIAQDSGLSPDTIQRYMLGRGEGYSSNTMEALLEYFNNRGLPTTPNDLYVITTGGEQLAEPLLVLDEPPALESQPPTPERPRQPRLLKRDQRDRYQKRKEAQAGQESSQPVPDAAS